MSASREKQKRKQQTAEGGAGKAQRSDINSIVFRNLVMVICVVLVISLVAVILVGQGVPQQFMTAVTADGQNITVAEFNFFYYAGLSEFYNSMGDFLVSYGMLDTSKSLSSQASWTEGETWHDYVVDTAISNIKSAVLWSESAKAEGVQMTDEDLQLIDDLIKTIKESADAQGMSVNKLLSSIYGRGINENNYRKFIERQVLASRYETYLYESFNFSDSEISEYYNDNKNLFDKVNYREFRVSKYVSNEEYERLTEKFGDDLDLEALVDSPVGEITFEAKRAYDKVAELVGKSDLTEENFNELAGELAYEEDKGNFEDPDFTLVENGSYAEGAFGDWLFDSARKHGDVSVLEDGDNYVAVMFLERKVEDDVTANMRQILITPASDDDAVWKDAENKAKAILERFNGGDEQKFISLVKDNTEDANTRYTGGLYKEMRRADMGDEEAVAEWLFAPERKPGDCEILKSASSYHIMYFVSQGRPYWQVNAENTLRNEKNTEIREEKSANSTDPKSNWLGMMITTKA